MFGELSPHPLLTHAVEQNAASLDMSIAALAAMRREQELPSARGFVADIHSAGAAVDFASVYPQGRLVDSPLPTWTHREPMLSRDDGTSRTVRRCWLCIHCWARMCICLEEPERHVWQGGEAGTGRIRGSATTRFTMSHTARWLYCEMALAGCADRSATSPRFTTSFSNTPCPR